MKLYLFVKDSLRGPLGFVEQDGDCIDGRMVGVTYIVEADNLPFVTESLDKARDVHFSSRNGERDNWRIVEIETNAQEARIVE